MVIKVKGKEYILQQSAIDPSVWIILRGGLLPKGGGRPLHPSFNPEEAESGAYGYLVTYVDDFLIMAPDDTIDQLSAVIAAKWKITEKPKVTFGSGGSVEYLSVNITATEKGFLLDQTVYTRDLLAKWSMEECRPSAH